MIVIFVMALIMTMKANTFINTYRMPDGTEDSGAYYIFYKSDANMTIKAFGSYYLLFN
jgi:hypothetical protein